MPWNLKKGGLWIVLFLCLKSASAQTGLDCENYGTTTPWNPLWNFYDIKQKMVTGLNIGNGFFRGLLEHTPTGYSQAANASKKYPVIIFFHGYGSRGNGTTSQLCRLFKDRGSDLATHLAVPGRVEREPDTFNPTVDGVKYEFIVISPQFNEYTRLVDGTPDHFPSGDEVEDVIDYVQSHYRIDTRRIYLTGLSNGANMITEYVGSSLARAKRVAAIMPVALCSQLNHPNNVSRGIDARFIGQAKLRSWFVYCEVDNCGIPGTDNDAPAAWVSAIKGVQGAVAPRYTILKNQNPATLYNCSDTLTHDAWSRAYNPSFTASFVNGNGANDGVNENIYTWFSSAQNAVLPVVMKDYSARLVQGNVKIEWTTTDEKDNASFTIERAGADQLFKSIGSLAGMGSYSGEKAYSFTDEQPLADLNLYRLVQTDIDGEKTYFDIKRVMNKEGGGPAIVISPNPFVSEISAFINLDRSQKVLVTLTDMTGKVLKSSTGIYGIGNTEIKFTAHELPRGMYLLRVTGENLGFTTKIVKK